MNSGYAPTPLDKKLGIKPGFTVSIINGPADFMVTLGSLITHAQIINHEVEDADIIHYFSTSKEALIVEFPHLKVLLGKQHALWISWPKKSSGIASDLNENIVREIGLNNDLVDVKVCAIDDTWSGLKFVYRLSDR